MSKGTYYETLLAQVFQQDIPMMIQSSNDKKINTNILDCSGYTFAIESVVIGIQ